MMNKTLQDYIDTDGTLTIFVVHKLGHVLAGMVVALLTYFLFQNALLALLLAMLAGIFRECMKTTPMYMHIATALITASGWVFAIPLFYASFEVQLVIGSVAFFYVIAVLYSIYLKT